MTEERKLLLNRRFRELARAQPEIKVLRRLLLGLGGIQLVAPQGPDPAMRLLINTGFAMAGPVQCKVMKTSACHQNIAKLWTEKRGRIVGIGTGYALSDDGLWREHSWGLRREGILETTEARTRYFGLLLQGFDADAFAESNYVRVPTKQRQTS